MLSEIGFMSRMNQMTPLLITLILTATACTTGAAPTEASGPAVTAICRHHLGGQLTEGQ